MLRADERAGSERFDLAAVGAWLERPVEGCERLARGQSAELQAGGYATLGFALDLSLDDALEEADG
ncbi:MAG TPA: hypothetical protein VNZ57_15400 [Longimicrobiales bacterium]|nr:hypothetical protein [Longimicrobiales bacterium]